MSPEPKDCRGRPCRTSVVIVQESPVFERDMGVVLCVFRVTGLPKAASLCSSTKTGFGEKLNSIAPAILKCLILSLLLMTISFLLKRILICCNLCFAGESFEFRQHSLDESCSHLLLRGFGRGWVNKSPPATRSLLDVEHSPAIECGRHCCVALIIPEGKVTGLTCYCGGPAAAHQYW